VAPEQATDPGQAVAPEQAAAAGEVLMPRMGTSVAEGTIVAWRVAVGDAVVRDQVLCEVSTDKEDVECPAFEDGVVAEILVAEGETVDVGAVIARLRRVGSVGSPSDDTALRAEAAGADPRADRRETLRRSSPVAARLAAERGIDLRALTGSGRNGRVTKGDVLAAAGVRTDPAGAEETPAEAPMHSDSPYRHDPSIPVAGHAAVPADPRGTVVPAAPDGTTVPGRAAVPAVPGGTAVPAGAAPTDLGGTAVPATRMRRAIGDAVRRSLDTAAHCTTVVECDMSAVERERRELGLTALPLLARAAIETLQAFPALNATYDGETVTRYGERVHLGIAVSLGEDGLIAPVIHDAQDLSVQGLARRIKDLAARARAGRLAPDEVRGGTFTITNPGAAGALIATPVLSLPQVAILDLEAIVRRPVVLTDADGGESIGIRPMVHLCMGWDHRALDGLYAAQFLTALRGRVEG
jgi:pyruvate/2-oxoglutarate dehydrogenase complex dihydrolipoamide acyltransferase (E2) component